jgi:hypothetical protein
MRRSAADIEAERRYIRAQRRREEEMQRQEKIANRREAKLKKKLRRQARLESEMKSVESTDVDESDVGEVAEPDGPCCLFCYTTVLLVAAPCGCKWVCKSCVSRWPRCPFNAHK